MPWTASSLAALMDHTILRPGHTLDDVRQTCREALEWKFHTVCASPYDLPTVAGELAGSGVKVGAALAIPMGFGTCAQKVRAAEEAVSAGADEVDFVVNLTAVASGRWNDVAEELSAMRSATEGRVLKLIFETCYLTDDQKRRLCDLCCEARLDFVKTSTGFGPGGATVEDIRLMKEQVAGRALVKASGGVRTFEQVEALARAGAVRIGTSSSVAIMRQFLGEKAEGGTRPGDE
ncbi:MAG: deoxyribose-phosphate aldolase [Planctomycetes bacterium]|nr:deoxyribose-phosphate aldolase [Planctomycetota bacterium]